MDALWSLLRALLDSLRVFGTVDPWELGLCVRLGRSVTTRSPGFYWFWPLVDHFYKQNARLRTLNLPVQTLTTHDGRTLTLSAAVSYAIADLLKLFDKLKLEEVEDTLGNLVMSEIGAWVQAHDAFDVTPAALSHAVSRAMRFRSLGLSDASVMLTDFAFVRTYRLITDSKWVDLKSSSFEGHGHE